MSHFGQNRMFITGSTHPPNSNPIYIEPFFTIRHVSPKMTVSKYVFQLLRWTTQPGDSHIITNSSSTAHSGSAPLDYSCSSLWALTPLERGLPWPFFSFPHQQETKPPMPAITRQYCVNCSNNGDPIFRTTTHQLHLSHMLPSPIQTPRNGVHFRRCGRAFGYCCASFMSVNVGPIGARS